MLLVTQHTWGPSSDPTSGSQPTCSTPPVLGWCILGYTAHVSFLNLIPFALQSKANSLIAANMVESRNTLTIWFCWTMAWGTEGRITCLFPSNNIMWHLGVLIRKWDAKSSKFSIRLLEHLFSCTTGQNTACMPFWKLLIHSSFYKIFRDICATAPSSDVVITLASTKAEISRTHNITHKDS